MKCEKEDRREPDRLLVFWASGVLHLVMTLFLGERERGILEKPFVVYPETAHDERQEFSARLVTNDLSE